MEGESEKRQHEKTRSFFENNYSDVALGRVASGENSGVVVTQDVFERRRSKEEMESVLSIRRSIIDAKRQRQRPSMMNNNVRPPAPLTLPPKRMMI